jgi:hypothetical protein
MAARGKGKEKAFLTLGLTDSRRIGEPTWFLTLGLTDSRLKSATHWVKAAGGLKRLTPGLAASLPRAVKLGVKVF